MEEESQMARQRIGAEPMNPVERKRRSRAMQGNLPMVAADVTIEDVARVAKQAGSSAVASLFGRELGRARQALRILLAISDAFEGDNFKDAVGRASAAVDEMVSRMAQLEYDIRLLPPR
jgi:hypothetical protein